MVTADVRASADGIRSAVNDRDLVSIGAIAVLGSGGVFLGQEIADMVMPMLVGSVDPSTPTELGVSAIVKLLAAVVLGMVATRLGTTGMALTGVMSFGILVSMGLDLIDMVQRGGLPGAAPSFNSGSSGGVSRTPSQAQPTAPSPSASSMGPTGGSRTAKGDYR